MKKPRRVKSRVFIVNCERNDDYEHELKSHGVAHEYHGYNFYIPVGVAPATASQFIARCLQKHNRPLISMTADRFFNALECNVWGLEQVEHSIEFGYHR